MTNWLRLLLLLLLLVVILTGGISSLLIKAAGWLFLRPLLEWNALSDFWLTLLLCWGVMVLFLLLSRRFWAAMENDVRYRYWVVAGLLAAILMLAFGASANSFKSSLAAIHFLAWWGITSLCLYSFRYYPWAEKYLLSWYSRLALVLAIVGLLDFFASGESRLSAEWVNPTLLAAFLLPAWLLALSGECGYQRHGWNVITIILIGAALVLSFSRGIIAALCVSIPLIIGHAYYHRRVAATGYTRFRRLAIVCILLLLLGNLAFGWGRWAGRGDPQAYGRLQIWQAAGAAVAVSPWRGIGAGCFADEMLRHKFPSRAYPFIWGQAARYAHNEYLHLAVECGLPALIIVGYFLAILLLKLWRLPVLNATTWAGIVFLLHCGIDNLWHFLPTALLGGILLAASVRRVMGPLPRGNTGQKQLGHGVMIFATAMIVFLTLPLAIGEYFFQQGRRWENERLIIQAQEAFVSATTVSPLSGIYWMYRGGTNLQIGKGISGMTPEIAANAGQFFAEAVTDFKLAIDNEPRNGIYFGHLSRAYFLLGQPLQAREVLRHATELDPTNAKLYRRLSALAAAAGDTEQAGAYLHRAITLEPLYADAYLDLYRMEPQQTTWRDLARAAHRYTYAYLRAIASAATVKTSIFNYAGSLQEYPASAYAALAEEASEEDVMTDNVVLYGDK